MATRRKCPSQLEVIARHEPFKEAADATSPTSTASRPLPRVKSQNAKTRGMALRCEQDYSSSN